MHICSDKPSHTLCTNLGLLPLWLYCVQRVGKKKIGFSDLLSACFLVNILFAWKDCLLHLARLAVLPSVKTTAESGFELLRGSGLLYVLVLDLKLCNQE